MALSEHRRRQLVTSLRELQHDRPIDNARIERGLVAILEALLDEGGSRALDLESTPVLTGADLGR